MKLLKIFDQFLLERTVLEKDDMDKAVISQAPNQKENNLIPMNILHTMHEDGSFFKSSYFCMPSMKIKIHQQKGYKHKKNKNWTHL